MALKNARRRGRTSDGLALALPSAPPLVKPRILIVDDCDGVRDALALLLATRYEVATACDAAEALARLRAGDLVPVIVSDYSMPGENGVELLTRVKREWPEIVGILHSATPDPCGAHAALERGDVFRMLTKPSTLETLAHAIDAALARNIQLAALRVRLADAPPARSLDDWRDAADRVA